jgi:hypothetical protein
VRAEGFNFPSAHFTRMSLVVREDEVPQAFAVGLLGPHGRVLEPEAVRLDQAAFSPAQLAAQ